MSRAAQKVAPGSQAPARAGEHRSTGDSAWGTEPASGVGLRGSELTRVPRLAMSMTAMKAMPLDHRAGFMASFVDGSFTIEMILDACALPQEEALELLAELAACGVIVL